MELMEYLTWSQFICLIQDYKPRTHNIYLPTQSSILFHLNWQSCYANSKKQTFNLHRKKKEEEKRERKIESRIYNLTDSHPGVVSRNFRFSLKRGKSAGGGGRCQSRRWNSRTLDIAGTKGSQSQSASNDFCARIRALFPKINEVVARRPRRIESISSRKKKKASDIGFSCERSRKMAATVGGASRHFNFFNWFNDLTLATGTLTVFNSRSLCEDPTLCTRQTLFVRVITPANLFTKHHSNEMI